MKQKKRENKLLATSLVALLCGRAEGCSGVGGGEGESKAAQFGS